MDNCANLRFGKTQQKMNCAHILYELLVWGCVLMKLQMLVIGNIWTQQHSQELKYSKSVFCYIFVYLKNFGRVTGDL